MFGVMTYYTESLEFEPLTYGIANPQLDEVLKSAE